MKIQIDKINHHLALIKLNYFLLVLPLMLLSPSTTAIAGDYIYISDKLRVGVRVEPIGGIPPISVVFTGMRLEVHEKTNGYLKITTNKGVTGWIKDIYVTKNAPAIIKLNKLQLKYKQLKKELVAGSDGAAMLETANLSLNHQLEKMKVERHDWTIERAKFMANQYKEPSWLWVIEIFLLIVVCFVAGVLWYKAQVKKRLGGLRI